MRFLNAAVDQRDDTHPRAEIAMILPAPDDGRWFIAMFTVVAKLADEGPGVVSHRVVHDQSVQFFRLIGWAFAEDDRNEPLVVAVRTGAAMAAEVVPLSEVLGKYAPEEGASAMDAEFRQVSGSLASLADKIVHRNDEAVWGDRRREAELAIKQDPQGQKGT